MKIAFFALNIVVAAAAPSLILAGTPPLIPAEVSASAPPGTTLLAYQASGAKDGAIAAAVYETSPDAEGVRHRVLTVFGNKTGKFIPEASNDRIIACSKCTQFHDDAFAPKYIEVSADRVHIDQFDSGEMPSTTSIDFERRRGAWYVGKATRVTYEAGGGIPLRENLPLPTSGLLQDMDGQWSVPPSFIAIVANDTTGRYSFLHGYHTAQELQKSIDGSYTCKVAGCRVLLKQSHDGCLSLARDSNGKSFGVATVDPQAKTEATHGAIDACKVAGGTECKEVETRCSSGIRILP
jgi:hypothetical protein